VNPIPRLALAIALIAAALTAGAAAPASAPAAGMLLVAARDMADPRFRGTVILLARHDESGSLGVVLNRPAKLSVGEAVPPLAATPAADQRLYLGGPVAIEQVLYLVRRSEPPAGLIPVIDDLHLGAARDRLEALLGEQPELPLRVFAGYAGWSAGQLAGELARTTWHLLPASADEVFADPEGLWHRLIERAAPSGILVWRGAAG
jgi:putative transcriptional regulator